MVPAFTSCPECRSVLRLPPVAPGNRLRCPKCKALFAPVVEAEEAISESVAVPLDEPHDSDRSYFERLASADDPFDPPKPQASEPVAEAEPVADVRPAPRPPAKQERASRDPEPSSGNLTTILLMLIGFVLVSGLAGASYIGYRIYRKDASPTTAETPKPERPSVPTPAAPASGLGGVTDATVYVRTFFPDGQTTSSGGFFVPGPGLVLTNARSVGQGSKSTTASKVVVTSGSRSLAARILGADADLDLALLQVAGLDLPKPLPLTTETFTVREPMPVVVFSAHADGVRHTDSNVAGSRDVAGSHHWFVLGGRLPQGTWGGPVSDSSGRVIGVSGVLNGGEASIAVPAEAALAFVQKVAKSAESGSAIAFATDTGRTRDTVDEPFPGGPNPWRQGRPLPPGFDGFPPNRIPEFPPGGPGWNQPMLPRRRDRER